MTYYRFGCSDQAVNSGVRSVDQRGDPHSLPPLSVERYIDQYSNMLDGRGLSAIWFRGDMQEVSNISMGFCKIPPRAPE